MKSTAIAKDMLIGKLITEHPEIIDTLMDAGMHCLGCPGGCPKFCVNSIS